MINLEWWELEREELERRGLERLRLEMESSEIVQIPSRRFLLLRMR